MNYLIQHESGRTIRLKAVGYRMSLEQADLLEEYIRHIPGVDTVTVHERTMGIMIGYSCDRSVLLDRLKTFTYAEAKASLPPVSPTGRELSREYKSKIIFHVLKHFFKKMYLPAPVRRIIAVVKAVPYVIRAFQCLFRRKIRVELLDGMAIGVSLLTNDHATASSVMFLLRLGDLMDEWTHKKSVNDLAQSMSLNVDKVWLKTEAGDVEVAVGQVRAGDQIVVGTGCLIPLDGEITEGEVMVNQASLTGESVPSAKRPGSSVYAGTVVEEGSCVIRVTRTDGGSKYDQIVKMIEDSERLNSKVEERASNLADKLVPWSLGTSLLTYLLSGNLTRAISVLMVDFSCALKLAMPLSVLSAMREASRYKIVVKGGKYLEKVSEARTIIFDKTGTLTKACPTLVKVVPFGSNDENEMLRIAACLEEHFPHSMANAVIRGAKERGLEHEEMHSEVEYIVAHGIATRIGEQRAIIGSYHFVFEDENVRIRPEDKPLFDALPPEYSQLYLAIGGTLSAALLIEDPLRAEAPDVIRRLHEAGFSKAVMITGDSRRTAEAMARRVGVDDFLSEVLPEDKAAYIQKEQALGRTVIMVGDGINDAPALSLADVGIAIGSGAAIAREVADITISADDLNELVFLKQLADALMSRIRKNYRFVIGFNGSLIGLGALGVLQPTASAMLHNGSTLLLSAGSMTPLIKA